jgi:hypothetical protein
VKKWIRVERTSYGPVVWLFGVIRVNSPGTLTPMLPRIYRGGDEYCNPTICLHLWPIGGVDVWWRGKRRGPQDGPCEECEMDG